MDKEKKLQILKRELEIAHEMLLKAEIDYRTLFTLIMGRGANNKDLLARQTAAKKLKEVLQMKIRHITDMIHEVEHGGTGIQA